MKKCFAIVALLWSFTSGAIAAQDIQAITPSGVDDLIAKNKGNVLVVDFFATWCPPCRQEIPGFIALHNKYSAQGLMIIGVSLDEGGTQVVKDFAQEMGINYPLYIGGSEVSQKYRIRAIPTTYIYDRSGKKVKTHIGFVAAEEFEKQIAELLQ